MSAPAALLIASYVLGIAVVFFSGLSARDLVAIELLLLRLLG